MTSWCPDMLEDSPKRNTKRLFLYASDEIAERLRRGYGVSGYVTRDYGYMAHMAWLIGSTSAAQALIREIDVVKTAWRKGDEQKTLLLIKISVPHMISVWLGGIDQQPGMTGDARRTRYEDAVSSMSSIINGSLCAKPSDASILTAQDIQSAAGMDRQCDPQTDDEGRRLVYACLLLSKALEACGQRCIDWGRLVFPVQSVQQLIDANALRDPGLPGDSQRLLRVANCLEQGVASVKRYHHMNMEGKMQPLGKG